MTEERMNCIVAKFCAEAINEPLLWFSEADLQVMLSSRLRGELSQLFLTGVKRGARSNPKSNAKYKTGLVHNEYGAEKGRRLDIAVFEKDDVKNIDDYRLRSSGRYLKPEFGFEIGTESITDIGEHLESDVCKLQDQVTKRGYVIHFYRDTAFADTGTKSREATEVSIEQRFKTHVQNCSCDRKVVILAFVVRTARMHDKLWGKCEMYRRDGDPPWEKTGLDKVERTVCKFLQQHAARAALVFPS